MLKQLADTGGQRRTDGAIQLLYLDSNKTFVFKDELEEMASRLPLSVSYLDSSDRLHQAIETFVTQHQNSSKYFVAGPKSMADSISAYLQKHKIAKANILKDAFFGY